MRISIFLPLCFSLVAVSFWGSRSGMLALHALRPDSPSIPKSCPAPVELLSWESPPETVSEEEPRQDRNAASLPGTLSERVRRIRERLQATESSPQEARRALMEICAASDAQAIQDFVAAQERSYRAQGGELGESAMIDFDRFAFEFAAKRLSEVAPVRAADIWSGSPLLPTELFLGAWARHFPADFVAWWRELPVDLQRESAPALGSLAAFSPEAFQSAANVLAASPAAECAAAEAYRATISPSVSEMFSANGPTWDAARAIQFLHSLPEGALRSGVLPLLVGDLLVFEEEQKWDLRDHPEFGSVFAQLPEDKVMAISPVSLARLERQAAHLPPCPMRDYAVLYGFRNGALEDPALAAEKLQSVSAQDYPAAVHGFAIGAADEDPVAALQWALSIDPSSAHRGKALERAAAAFFRQDPERARRWVEKAALSDGEYRLLTGHDRLN